MFAVIAIVYIVIMIPAKYSSSKLSDVVIKTRYFIEKIIEKKLSL